jgi:hypothetical protein
MKVQMIPGLRGELIVVFVQLAPLAFSSYVTSTN